MRFVPITEAVGKTIVRVIVDEEFRHSLVIVFSDGTHATVRAEEGYLGDATLAFDWTAKQCKIPLDAASQAKAELARLEKELSLLDESSEEYDDTYGEIVAVRDTIKRLEQISLDADAPGG